MSKQDFILLLFSVMACTITVVMYLIYRTSKNADDESHGMENPPRKRLIYFSILTFCLLVLLAFTLPKSPYYSYKYVTPEKVVYVTARQYVFFMSFSQMSPDNPKMDEIELPVDEVVEFHVTASDVNHDFAIYDENMTLVTQAQAMPGYVNVLRWKFDKPGEYTVLCLEYCGSGHALMSTSFTVN